jgi:hypothetical protein
MLEISHTLNSLTGVGGLIQEIEGRTPYFANFERSIN